MLAWRIVGAVLAAVLIAVIAIDLSVEGDEPNRVLLYEKGIYLGQPDTGISDELRAQIRLRGRTAGSAR